MKSTVEPDDGLNFPDNNWVLTALVSTLVDSTALRNPFANGVVVLLDKLLAMSGHLFYSNVAPLIRGESRSGSPPLPLISVDGFGVLLVFGLRIAAFDLRFAK